MFSVLSLFSSSFDVFLSLQISIFPCFCISVSPCFYAFRFVALLSCLSISSFSWICVFISLYLVFLSSCLTSDFPSSIPSLSLWIWRTFVSWHALLLTKILLLSGKSQRPLGPEKQVILPSLQIWKLRLCLLVLVSHLWVSSSTSSLCMGSRSPAMGVCVRICALRGESATQNPTSQLGYIYRYHTEIQVYPVTSMSERSPPLLLKNKIILATCGFSFGPAQSRWR